MKRQWEKICKILANHISDKELISEICKEVLKLNSKKQSNLKTRKRPGQTFY
jgi:Asp-tRNA(Asn)/Glu-tRNA(Gln) amidotransferase B subunit